MSTFGLHCDSVKLWSQTDEAHHGICSAMYPSHTLVIVEATVANGRLPPCGGSERRPWKSVQL